MQLTTIIAGYLFLVACGRAENCPAAQFEMSGLDRPININTLAQAPLVLVAMVTEVRAIGAPQKVDRLPRMLIECAEITANVEGVLRGEFSAQSVKFFYYTLSKYSALDLGPPKYIPIVGQRRIFFLRFEGNLIRSIGDVRDYTLRVFSGYHNIPDLNSLPFGQKVAVVLLTPGQRYNSVELARTLGDGVFVSDQLNSVKYTDMLLKSLLSVQSGEINRTVSQLIADRTWWKRNHK